MDGKSPRRGRAVRLAPIVLLVLVPAWAFAAAEGDSLRQASSLRADLGQLIDEYESLARQAPVHDEVLQMLAEARGYLDRVPDRELIAFAPELGPAVARLRRTATALRLETAVPSSTPAAKSDGLPSAPYPEVNWSFAIDAFTDIGQIPTTTGSTSYVGLCTKSVAPTPNQQFLMLNVDLAAEALRDTADRLCSFVGSIAGEGASLSLICIVSDLIFAVENTIKENWFLCGSVMEGAEVRASYFRLKHLHDDLAAAESTLGGRLAQAEAAVTAELSQNAALLASLDHDLMVHDQHLTASADQIDGQIDAHRAALLAFQAASLRSHVELRLSEADHGPVARLFLPEAFGGNLETVRDIVDETIGEAAAIGHDVHQAERLFAEADASLSALEFKAAYDLYGQAYRAAVK